MILFACEVAAAIWGFMNRDTVRKNTHLPPTFHLCTSVLLRFWNSLSYPCCPQISKELINFYDTAYIKAVDVSGSASKDAAIKVLDVFHKTVSQDGKSSRHLALTWHVNMNRNIFYYAPTEWLILCFCSLSSTAVVKEMTLCYSNNSPAPCVPQSLQQTFWHLR